MAPFMEEIFSIFCLLMVLVFVLVGVLGWVQLPPHTGLEVLFILPFSGALDRAMKTLAAGMCGKFSDLL